MGQLLLHSLVAALASLAIGFVWYNPKVFGSIWMRETGMTEEKAREANMAVMLLMTLFYSFLIAFILHMVVIHQFGAMGMIGGKPELAKPSYDAFMADYGTEFRTFKHGALHGFMSGLFFALPVVGTGALYERRSWKYTLVAGGYWVVTCMVMGGIVCAWQ
ncbi:DUF1761 domain-containing protein [Flavobacterium longum]|uniref:DUF1761 domain-containing protein n=1 Tax=Flavobacterium longum TaxID=1299340 RepID=UPI0039EA3C8B